MSGTAELGLSPTDATRNGRSRRTVREFAATPEPERLRWRLSRHSDPVVPCQPPCLTAPLAYSSFAVDAVNVTLIAAPRFSPSVTCVLLNPRPLARGSPRNRDHVCALRNSVTMHVARQVESYQLRACVQLEIAA